MKHAEHNVVNEFFTSVLKLCVVAFCISRILHTNKVLNSIFKSLTLTRLDLNFNVVVGFLAILEHQNISVVKTSLCKTKINYLKKWQFKKKTMNKGHTALK
jgi:hypothetical protein